MKKRSVSHWERNKYFDGLLLFAESLEEYNEPRKQDRQNGQNKLECSYG
jgi:hypothetical protein